MCARLFTAITRHKPQTISWFFTGTVVLVWSGVVATDRGLGQRGQLSVLGALALLLYVVGKISNRPYRLLAMLCER